MQAAVLRPVCADQVLRSLRSWSVSKEECRHRAVLAADTSLHKLTSTAASAPVAASCGRGCCASPAAAAKAERDERAERVDRAERAERAERPERPDSPERADRADKAERAALSTLLGVLPCCCCCCCSSAVSGCCSPGSCNGAHAAPESIYQHDTSYYSGPMFCGEQPTCIA